MPDKVRFDKELGELIQLHRATCGVTQEELASRVGLTRSQIAEYEAGIACIPLRRFCVIMNALDQDPASALANLQQRLFLAKIEANSERYGQRFLASNRGRQIVNALAMCDRPEALDALADLIMSIGIHACVRGGGEQKVSHEGVEPNNPQ